MELLDLNSTDNCDLKYIYDLINNRKNICCQGDAGTGKTTLIKKIIKACKQKNIDYKSTALTGIAASNIGDGTSTLHSLFGDLKEQTIQHEHPAFFDKLIKSSRFKSTIKNLDEKNGILIIDEVSMLSANLFDMIIRAIRYHGYSWKNFQIILFGDVKQLDPIISYYNKDVRIKKTFEIRQHWLPNSEIFQLIFGENFVKLKKNYRSSNDIQFTTDKYLLGRGFDIRPISDTSIIKQCIDRVNSLVVNRNINELIQEHPDKTIVVPFNDEKKTINNYILKKNTNQKYKFNRRISIERNPRKTDNNYIDKCVRHLDDSGSYEPNFNYSIASPVMLRKNISVPNGLVTGIVGTIVEVKEESEEIIVEFNVKNVSIRETITIQKFTYPEDNSINVEAFPLILGPCYTINSIQGLTLSGVIFHMNAHDKSGKKYSDYIQTFKTFTYGKLYMVISRVRHYSDIIINCNRHISKEDFYQPKEKIDWEYNIR